MCSQQPTLCASHVSCPGHRGCDDCSCGSRGSAPDHHLWRQQQVGSLSRVCAWPRRRRCRRPPHAPCTDQHETSQLLPTSPKQLPQLSIFPRVCDMVALLPLSTRKRCWVCASVCYRSFKLNSRQWHSATGEVWRGEVGVAATPAKPLSHDSQPITILACAFLFPPSHHPAHRPCTAVPPASFSQRLVQLLTYA
jgi:hypothetical protein